ncbi:3-hydroxyacyl-CoA dehydrogenase NAD-binding domain-containing protein [Thalassovita sp.]|uniref:3-hydroxyacyl-CoA dehydrogenase NAD-binding domain-containing protein n=1 Tax=Thalassovita sp. TaxID=1979401 RepID=UPI0029DE6648|nr:3-hydroxyacyl-CoA dehydrogenase NAD-binding domain-containing protein [Thalassovita sp.]
MSDRIEGQAGPVTLEMVGDIAVVTIDSPPMNTLSFPVRKGMLDATTAAQANPDARAILFVCNGRSFIAGAEISEFGKPRQPPATADVIRLFEASQKPVIAAIHGTALGGGFEFAMGCHYRVALGSAKVGLPEVNLGIIPGGGGTQRMPRLVGAKVALDLILSGRHVAAPEACALGLIDEVFDLPDARSAGLAFARHVIDTGMPPRSTRDITERLEADRAHPEIFETARASLQRRARGQIAPYRIVDAVQASLDRPFDDGLAYERELFLECMDTPQRKALVHAFFAERKAAKIPDAEGATARPVNTIGIVGGGTMGAGIAVSAIDAGLDVVMIERDDESLQKARQNIERVYKRAITKGRMTQAERDTLLQRRYRSSADYGALSDADVIIEAVFEDMDVKKAVFRELDKVAKPGAVLATNTSRMDINEIGGVTSRPQDVIGLHFFSPANIMRLVEVIVGDASAPKTIATATVLSKKLGKVGVRSGVCDGFIGNRMMSFYKKASEYLVLDGVSPYDLDRAVTGFGFPMGPHQVSDLAGLDIGWASRKRLAPTRDPRERYVAIADRICEQGWFGQKSGRGFYIYDEESPRGRPNPDVLDIIDAERTANGITPRHFSDEEIVQRMVSILINEGANVLHDKIALRPLDIDVTFLLGFGFPRWRGGPMFYADSIGLETVLNTIRANTAEDPFFWSPSPLLVDLVQQNRTFESLNS